MWSGLVLRLTAPSQNKLPTHHLRNDDEHEVLLVEMSPGCEEYEVCVAGDEMISAIGDRHGSDGRMNSIKTVVGETKCS